VYENCFEITKADVIQILSISYIKLAQKSQGAIISPFLVFWGEAVGVVEN
jgi:hypothetical protein